VIDQAIDRTTTRTKEPQACLSTNQEIDSTNIDTDNKCIGTCLVEAEEEAAVAEAVATMGVEVVVEHLPDTTTRIATTMDQEDPTTTTNKRSSSSLMEQGSYRV
jgi:hypothetical protein